MVLITYYYTKSSLLSVVLFVLDENTYVVLTYLKIGIFFEYGNKCNFFSFFQAQHETSHTSKNMTNFETFHMVISPSIKGLISKEE